MRKRFIYYLKKSDTVYYIVTGGIVSTTTVKTPFSADPIEWAETTLEYRRNVNYHGINFKYAAPLSMVKDAALILRYAMMVEGGIEAPCIFLAEKIDDATQIYLPYYSCDVDFSQATNTENYVQVELLERGLYQMIKDRENTPYEIPISFSDHIPLIHDGILLQAGYVNATIARSESTYNSTQLWAVETVPVSKDGDFSVGEQKAQEWRSMGTPLGPSWGTDSAEHNNYIYQVDKALTSGVDARLRIQHEIQYTNPSGTGMNYQLELRYFVANESSGAYTQTGTLYTDSPLAPGAPARRLVFDFTTGIIHMNPGDRLYYVFYILGPGASGGANQSHVVFFGNQRVDVLMDFRYPNTLMYGYWYRDLFSKLVAKMTEGSYSSRSDFLNSPGMVTMDNHPYKTLVLSGDAIRGLGDVFDPPVIKTTLRDLFKDATSRWQVGLGVEPDGLGSYIVRLEPLAYFYDSGSVILDLGLVNKFEWSYALEFIHGQLKIGNQNFDYDKLNGRDEPNTTQVFKLPITRKPDDMDLVATYRADMYGIEIVRANLSDKKTTDSNSDNAVFVIETSDNTSTLTVAGNSVNGYTLRRDQNLSGNSASGLRSPSSAYNLSLSPKRNLYRNGSIIRTAAFQQDTKDVKFQTTDKNADLVSNLGSGIITEKADVPIVSLNQPVFQPIMMKFETRVPENLPSIIEANPYGRITFSVNLGGRVKSFSGFIYVVSIKPSTNGVCQWQLLAAPTITLTDLIF